MVSFSQKENQSQLNEKTQGAIEKMQKQVFVLYGVSWQVFLCVRVQAQSQLHLYRQIINKKHKYVNRAARNNRDFCVGLMIQTCF